MKKATTRVYAEYSVRKWREKLEKALKESNLDDTSRLYNHIEGVIARMGNIAVSMEIPLEFMEGVTKRELVEAMELEFTFDYALPQNLVDDIRDKTGQYIPQHLIWDADNGIAVPITKYGKIIMDIYTHITEY